MRGKLALFVPAVAISVFCTIPATAQAHSSGKSTEARSKGAPANEPESRSLGTTQAFFQRLSAQNLTAKSTYDFVTPSGTTIPVALSNQYLKNGKFSMTGGGNGNGRSTKASTFILKGNEHRTYGWLALPEEGIAYEITNDANGEVKVSRVPYTKVYPVCDLQYPVESAWPAPRAAGENNLLDELDPHIGEYPEGTDVNELQSKPDSEYVMYMDITDIMNGDEPITLSSKAEVWMAWQSLASGLSVFDVNVTTSKKLYDARVAEDVTKTGIAQFLNQDGRSFSPLDAFGTTSPSQNFKNQEEGYGLGRTAFHEVGHTMGLSHDGGGGDGEYFGGIAEFQWIPIMGNYWYAAGWDQPLFQYSLGEYTDASNQEEDFVEILEELQYRPDDNASGKPLNISSGKVDPMKNRGIIENNEDTDEFSFTVSKKGKVLLHADRIEYIGGAMLDIHFSLKNESGDVLAEDNPKAARYADLAADVEPGKYTVVIEGGAEGTPANGFPKFGSVGFYAIEGEIEGAEDGEDTGEDSSDTSTDTGSGSETETETDTPSTDCRECDSSTDDGGSSSASTSETDTETDTGEGSSDGTGDGTEGTDTTTTEVSGEESGDTESDSGGEGTNKQNTGCAIDSGASTWATLLGLGVLAVRRRRRS